MRETNASDVWNQIGPEVIALAWSEWNRPGGFHERFCNDPRGAIRERFGIEAAGELAPFELPEPPLLRAHAVQASAEAESLYPFTCC